MVTSNIENGCGSIVLTPNRSASWRANRRLIIALGAFTLLIGIAWTSMGAYMVLPFAGLEVSLLAYFLYRVSHQTHRKQVLIFDKDCINVELGVQFPTQRWSLSRSDCFFNIRRPNHPLDGPLIDLCDHHTQIELSSFLNKQDRENLLTIIRPIGLRLKRFEQVSHLDA